MGNEECETENLKWEALVKYFKGSLDFQRNVQPDVHVLEK